MSEYNYYEFLAIDRPLDAAEQEAVRALSTRATITDQLPQRAPLGRLQGRSQDAFGRESDDELESPVPPVLAT